MAAPDFTERTKRTIADRAGNCCSFCEAPTSGPNQDPGKATILGEACHIRGKQPSAPRYDNRMTDEERADISNALWACRNCHGKFDKDFKQYSVDTLLAIRERAEGRARERQCKVPTSPSACALRDLPQQWCHETTNDATYVRRGAALAQLNAWFNNPQIRAISLVGMGGAGKTSLVGNWLKVDKSDLVRDVQGLFYWSFYVEKSVDVFLRALLDFVESINTKVELKIDVSDVLSEIEKAFPKLTPLILVLDGLEVLQHAVSEGREYGAFIDAKLRDFILFVVYAQKPWLCIITSRFPITDLRHATPAQTLELTHLEPEEGAEVLYQNQVLGRVDERLHISSFLHGHPLALRIFAATVPRELRATPLRHLREVFGAAAEGNAFYEKLLRLLEFYSKTLAELQRAVLSALSLFRSPVPQRAITIIVQGLGHAEGESETDMALAINRDISRLHRTGLVIRDRRATTDVYACHPIVRDYFRRHLLGSRARESQVAIGILLSRPDELGIQGATNLEPLLLASEALLLNGSVAQALEIFITRFDAGKAFLERGLPKEGKRLFDAFVQHVTEFPAYVSGLAVVSGYDSVFFRNGAMLFNILLGEHADAQQLAEKQLATAKGSRRATSYSHLTLMALHRGEFESAIEFAENARQATMQTEAQGSRALIQAQAQYMRVRALISLGLIDEARSAFKPLKRLHDSIDSDDGWIAILLAELCLCSCDDRIGCGHLARDVKAMARRVTEDHLALDAKLTVARWHIVRQRPGKMGEQLLAGVYEHAVAQSYPYFMLTAEILREYRAYRAGNPVSAYTLDRAAAMAEANQMRATQAEALWVRRLTETDAATRATVSGRSESLISELSYNGLPKLLPP